ncbi:MAG: hypothetical protein Q4Q06_07475 [Bacteroidota bacterium]|nr:hypothetical protein [Bacteroidota bacterium]
MEEINDIQKQNEESIKLTPSLKTEIFSCLKYGKVVAIIGFVSAFLMLVMAINMLSIRNTNLSEMENSELLESVTLGISIFSAIFMIVMAGVLCYLSFLAFVGCKKINSALSYGLQEDYLKGTHKIRIFIQIVAILSAIGVFFSFLSTMMALVMNIIK